jgi:hypothetical protein
VADSLNPAVALDPGNGYPLVAVIVTLGEGDAVPVDLLASHLARFDWPAAHADKNAVVEPYAWNVIERRLVAEGVAAVPHLVRAPRRHAPTEEKALRVIDRLLAIGGPPVGEGLASLLEVKRDLGGVRVCDLAAAALALLSRDGASLALEEGDALVREAGAWWSKVRGLPPGARLARAAARAAENGDADLLGLLVGERVEKPREWSKKSAGWMPVAGPYDVKALLEAFKGDRCAAFEANRRLEEATGRILWTPRARNLGELRASLRNWNPGPDLAVRWKRLLEGTLVRMTVALVGYHELEGAPGIIWSRETVYPAVENGQESGGGVIERGDFFLHVHSRDMGTSVVYSEYLACKEGILGRTTGYPMDRPAIFPTEPVKAMGIVIIEEALARTPPRPPAVLAKDLKALLRRELEGAEGEYREQCLRALAYFQDDEDRERFRAEGSAVPLLIMGDPAGLEGKPVLKLHEIEMGLRKAKTDDVRLYLEGLRVDLEK